jgi:coniferyl-aldehyde dehydrogenase
LDEFVRLYVAVVRKLYPHILDNEQYCSVINDAAFDRIVELVADARREGATVIDIVPPGEDLPDRDRRKVAPTVLTGVTQEMSVAHDEVFGPVLAVHGYDHVGDAIDYINARPSPLAGYWYGPGGDDYDRFCREIRCGGITRNDFSLHAALPDLPFGGVGASGMGAYHGKAGFDAFSHRRPVVESDLPISVGAMAAAAPVTASVEMMLRGYAWLTRFRLRKSSGLQL